MICVAVLVREGKVLIQKRYRPNKGMIFEFPCGRTELGENLTNACSRELQEELGLTELKVLFHTVLENVEGESVGFVVFECPSNKNPEIIDPRRKQEFYWLSVDEVLELELPRTDLKFVEDILRPWLEEDCS